MAEFVNIQPEVSLDVDYNDRQVNLIESSIDMAVRITSQLDPTRWPRRLSTSRMLTLASPDYLARHGRPELPQDPGGPPLPWHHASARSSWPFPRSMVKPKGPARTHAGGVAKAMVGRQVGAAVAGRGNHQGRVRAATLQLRLPASGVL